jgi:hypothetical protein
VVWGAVLPDAKYSVVGGHNLEGGFLATRHMLQSGARRIAFLGNTKYPEVNLRYKGYLRAHKEFGIKPDKALCNDSLFQSREVETAIGQWLDQGCSLTACLPPAMWRPRPWWSCSRKESRARPAARSCWVLNWWCAKARQILTHLAAAICRLRAYSRTVAIRAANPTNTPPVTLLKTRITRAWRR